MDKAQPSMERMANVIGHEIRNPLAVIGNSVYFVKMKLGEGVEPKVGKHLGMIESEVRRADGLIAQLLAYARPVEVRCEPLAVRELVETALAAKPAPAKVKVSLESGAREARVQADRELAVGALKRLLENAFDAAGHGGSVTVEAAASTRSVDIVVRDSGPGVAAEARAKLFEPFAATKPRGLGLGLATARKFAESQGGSVDLLEGGPGAAFRLRLPAA